MSDADYEAREKAAMADLVARVAADPAWIERMLLEARESAGKVAGLQTKVQLLEHRLAQAAETERVLRAHRAPLRRIAELEAQLAMLTSTAPDALAAPLQARVSALEVELADYKKRHRAQTQQIKHIETHRAAEKANVQGMRDRIAELAEEKLRG